MKVTAKNHILYIYIAKLRIDSSKKKTYKFGEGLHCNGKFGINMKISSYKDCRTKKKLVEILKWNRICVFLSRSDIAVIYYV